MKNSLKRKASMQSFITRSLKAQYNKKSAPERKVGSGFFYAVKLAVESLDYRSEKAVFSIAAEKSSHYLSEFSRTDE